MINHDYSDQEHLQRASYRQNFVRSRADAVDESIKLSIPKIPRNPPSSLGHLDALPVELLYETFDYLDIQPLFRLARVSFRGKFLVESRPA